MLKENLQVRSRDVSTKEHLVLTISPNIWEENIQAWGMKYHQQLYSEKTFQMNGKAYTSSEDKELTKLLKVCHKINYEMWKVNGNQQELKVSLNC